MTVEERRAKDRVRAAARYVEQRINRWCVSCGRDTRGSVRCAECAATHERRQRARAAFIGSAAAGGVSTNDTGRE